MITLVCVVIMRHLAMKQFTVKGLALPSAGASAFWVRRGSGCPGQGVLGHSLLSLRAILLTEAGQRSRQEESLTDSASIY